MIKFKMHFTKLQTAKLSNTYSQLRTNYFVIDDLIKGPYCISEVDILHNNFFQKVIQSDDEN